MALGQLSVSTILDNEKVVIAFVLTKPVNELVSELPLHMSVDGGNTWCSDGYLVDFRRKVINVPEDIVNKLLSRWFDAKFVVLPVYAQESDLVLTELVWLTRTERPFDFLADIAELGRVSVSELRASWVLFAHGE